MRRSWHPRHPVSKSTGTASRSSLITLYRRGKEWPSSLEARFITPKCRQAIFWVEGNPDIYLQDETQMKTANLKTWRLPKTIVSIQWNRVARNITKMKCPMKPMYACIPTTKLPIARKTLLLPSHLLLRIPSLSNSVSAAREASSLEKSREFLPWRKRR